MAPLHLTTINISAPDPENLARFYARLLGWEMTVFDPGWVTVQPADGSVGLVISEEPAGFARPVWPARDGEQQMMMHFELRADSVLDGVRHALQAGATLAPYQPNPHIRVLIDPVGHPFCIWT
ncbi:VOC family protein [Nigerium massiliense]|uniref:VOC family protein n=1 Tax=Nigerium massiliense TaxID=1522317 RepID=UPI00058E9B86|nr:VOC family protein [Nigerium massiliense]